MEDPFSIFVLEEGDKVLQFICWLVDNGASHHMCNDERMFNKLQASMISGLELADEGTTPAKGEGPVLLVLDSTKNICLRLDVVVLVPGKGKHFVCTRPRLL